MKTPTHQEFDQSGFPLSKNICKHQSAILSFDKTGHHMSCIECGALVKLNGAHDQWIPVNSKEYQMSIETNGQKIKVKEITGVNSEDNMVTNIYKPIDYTLRDLYYFVNGEFIPINQSYDLLCDAPLAVRDFKKTKTVGVTFGFMTPENEQDRLISVYNGLLRRHGRPVDGLISIRYEVPWEGENEL